MNNGMVVMQISATGSIDKEFLEVESDPSLRPLTERKTPLQMGISLIHVDVSYEGEQILPGQVLPLWHTDYLKPVSFKKQQTQVKL